MKIINIEGMPVKGCAFFDYKGYSISSSLIGLHLEIIVFDDNDAAQYCCGSVESAIQWVNREVAK